MQIRARIVAGTALALLMSSAYAGASASGTTIPSPETIRAGAEAHHPDTTSGAPLLLAQAEEEGEDAQREEEPRADEPDSAPEAAEEPPATPAEEPEAPPAEEAPPAPEPEPEPEAQQPEPAPEPEPEPEAPQEEPEAPAQDEAPTPEEAPAPPAEPEAPVEPETPAEPDEPEAPADAVEPEAPADSAEPEAPAEPAPPAEPEPAPEPEAPADSDAAPAEPTPPAEDAEPQPPRPDARPPLDGETEPAPDEAAPPAEDGELPIEGEAEPDGESTQEAPILDSQKEDPAAPDAAGEPAEAQPVEEPAEAAPPPTSDEEAQQFEAPVEVQSLRAEEGRRIDRREGRRERHEGSNVLREIGDRVVIQLNNQVVVQSDDRGRIGRDASEVYYEELPRGRTRETVVRENGVQVVTVYDRYGDVLSRSRFTPDGREHVLVYADYRDREDRREWRDPGMDLPPLRLTIPAEEYTLDARRVRDERAYYDFLNQPPVEPVRRLYSVDEVRYSARVRDSVRRVEMDTITFDFGSASISEDAIPLLSGVANAIEQLLEENQAEVFLIEGHTDAVGTDEANLALSDQRAEAVATALTNVFGIPPENMVTQGYGERYLKIDTEEPERQNRRVVMRRITPLVAPVASR